MVKWFLSFFLFTTSSIAADLTSFLVISDIHLNLNARRVMEFRPRSQSISNDLDLPTFKILLAKIRENINAKLIPKPGFIILLGDLNNHTLFTKTPCKNAITVFRLMHEIFPKTPIFYTFGNNDSCSGHYGPFKSGKLESPYDLALMAGWKDGFLSTGKSCKEYKNFPCLAQKDINSGYYSALLAPKLRLISLNSVLFSSHRKNVKPKEALKHLAWLEKQLKKAKSTSESVLISMHIPPGFNIYDHSAFWLPNEERVFLNLEKTYHSNIIGLLAGHTHHDEIKIIRDGAKTIAGVFYTPALSTAFGNAPAFKMFTLIQNQHHWLLSDYQSYHFKKSLNKIMLEKLYAYNDYYCEIKNQNLFRYLGRVNIHKMQRYYSAGNENFAGIIGSPNDMVLSM